MLCRNAQVTIRHARCDCIAADQDSVTTAIGRSAVRHHGCATDPDQRLADGHAIAIRHHFVTGTKRFDRNGSFGRLDHRAGKEARLAAAVTGLVVMVVVVVVVVVPVIMATVVVAPAEGAATIP
ncbi:hypothetical protein AA103193_1018 [Tanticharoenia sakaeratensis NBRC 103193]|nr:hypothetical protein AA103193_1018 [Tanticharoenia sakaeratensis NBRC 103193]